MRAVHYTERIYEGSPTPVRHTLAFYVFGWYFVFQWSVTR